MGFGALLSAATIALAGHQLTRGRVMIDSSIVYGLALVVFAASPWYPLSIAAMAVTGLCHVHANALVHTVVQSNSPPAYRGRTMALFNMAQMLSTAGGMLIGLLAAVLGSRGAVAAMGMTGEQFDCLLHSPPARCAPPAWPGRRLIPPSPCA
jgi:predicted MFS family arabinose efflux permease